MYDRLRLNRLPFPLNDIPPQSERCATWAFLPIMHTLLQQCQGLAEVAHGASMSSEVSYQALEHTLQVLSGTLEATLALFERWEEDMHPGPICDCPLLEAQRTVEDRQKEEDAR